MIKHDAAGNPEVVARVLAEKVEIRTKEIRQFLAIKDMHLAVQVDINRYAGMPVEDYPGRNLEDFSREKDASFHWGVRNCNFRKPYRTHAYFTGKKLLAPLPKAEAAKWPFIEKDESYPTFIIGRDDHGNEVEFTCEESPRF